MEDETKFKNSNIHLVVDDEVVQWIHAPSPSQVIRDLPILSRIRGPFSYKFRTGYDFLDRIHEEVENF